MSLTDPIESAFVVTPDDNTDLIRDTRGVYVGSSGDLRVDLVGEVTTVFSGLAAGIIHPIRVRKVYSTGTDAASILGVY